MFQALSRIQTKIVTESQKAVHTNLFCLLLHVFPHKLHEKYEPLRRMHVNYVCVYDVREIRVNKVSILDKV